MIDPQTLEASTRFLPSADVATRPLDEACFLVHLQSNQIFELNPTGARLWGLVTEGHALGEVRRTLRDEFDSDGADIRHDVDELISALLAEDLLVVAPPVAAKVELASPKIEPPRSDLPTGTWVLRCEPGSDGLATRVYGGTGSHESCALASGARVVVDGYLFDDDPGRPSSRSPGLNARRAGIAYEAAGDQFLSELRGGFLAAVSDHRRARLIAGRDATGLRPCFYFWNGRSFLLSSSIDALLSQPEVTPRFNRLLLAEYLTDQMPSDRATETFYEGIRRLLPGERLVFDGNEVRVDRFWEPLPEGFSWASAEEVDTLPELLQTAVARCLALGADSLALSGGFDSVSLAILANGLRPERPLHALSMSFSGAAGDETATQRAVAQALGMPQTFEELSLAPPASPASPASIDTDFVNRALSSSGALPSPILSLWQAPFSRLLRKASDAGLRSLLFGTGGDEVFGVDPAHAEDLLSSGDVRGLSEFRRAWRDTESAGTALRRFSAFRSPLERLLGPLAPPLKRSWRAVRRRTPRIVIGDPDLARTLADRRGASRSQDGASGAGSYVRAMRDLFTAPQLLLGLDQGDRLMAPFGLTPLYPFFDRDLVALALRTPPGALYAGGQLKRPLRDSVARRLPSVTLPTRKIDFTDLGRNVLRQAGPATFHSLGGAPLLADLGILDVKPTKELVEGFFAGRHSSWLPVWLVLSTEAWLQARSPAQRASGGAA